MQKPNVMRYRLINSTRSSYQVHAYLYVGSTTFDHVQFIFIIYRNALNSRQLGLELPSFLTFNSKTFPFNGGLLKCIEPCFIMVDFLSTCQPMKGIYYKFNHTAGRLPLFKMSIYTAHIFYIQDPLQVVLLLPDK